MISVLLDNELLRQRRLEIGLTQSRLSELSELSERTIRYAEAGKPIRKDYAIRLAESLEIPLASIEKSALTKSLEQPEGDGEWKALAEMIGQAIDAYAHTREIEPILTMCHPDVVFSSQSTPDNGFNGIFRGMTEVREFFKAALTFMRQFPSRRYEITGIHGDGPVVVVNLIDRLADPQQDETSYWVTQIFTVKNGQITRFDQRAGMIED